MDKTILAPGIIVYHNIMPESDALPILIEDTYGWFQGEAVESRNKKDGYENVRKVGIFHLSESVPEDPAILQWSKTVEKELSLCQQDYIKHYAIDTLANINSGYQVLSYGIGDYFSEHTDEVPEAPRRISGVYYINDNYEGGELFFSQFNISFKPLAKDYILFPSIWAYSHTAMPVISGTKNAIVHFLA
jgi:hypothetical protein